MMSTLDAGMMAAAVRDAAAYWEALPGHVETLEHADGSLTVIMRDDDPRDPREDYDHTAVLVADGNSRMSGPTEGDALADARSRWHPGGYILSGYGAWRDRWTGRATPAPLEMLRRYAAMWRPDILHVDEWSVTGPSQSDWQSGYGYVTRAGWAAAMGEDYAGDVTPADHFRSEVAEYAAYWAGDVYGAVHISAGAPAVAYGPHGAYVDGYTVDEESVWGYLGYDDTAAIAAEHTGSPVTGRSYGGAS